mgnify:FL=1
MRPAIRAALSALSGTGDVAPLNDAVLLSLERAESELAPLAAIDAGALTTLRRVRALVDHARRGERCEGCRAQVVRGLWQALSDSAADAPARARARVSPVAGRYLERLEGTP